MKADAIIGKNDGDTVAAGDFLDQSGNGNNPTAATGAVYKTNVISGLPVVRTSGASYYQFDPYWFSGPFTIVAVASQRSRVDYGTLLAGNTSGNLELGLNDSNPSKLSISRSSQATQTSDLTLPADGAFHVLTWRSGGADVTNPHVKGAIAQIRKDGDSGTGVSITVTSAGTDTYLFRSLGEAPGGWWDGDLAEILIYNSVLSYTELKQVESYLANKYGIALASDPTFSITPTVFRGWWGGSTPAISQGGSGAFDEGLCEVTAVYYEGGTYYVYYTGWNPAETEAQIGLATGSSLISLTKQGAILTKNAGSPFRQAYVSGGRVHKFGGTYYLYFWGSNTASFEGEPGVLGVATASNPAGPFTVQNSDNAIIGLESGMSIIYRPFVVDNTATDGFYYLFANAKASGLEHIYVWSSSDLVTGWSIANSGNPVLSSGSAPFASRIGDPTIIPNGSGGWLMVYFGGTDPHPALVGLATSTGSLTSWTNYSRNPGWVVAKGPAIRPAPVFDGAKWRATADDIQDIYAIELDIQP